MKNKYKGKWEEKGWKNIDFDYSYENLKFLLEKICLGEEIEFTHQDIVNWCDGFMMETLEGSLEHSNDKLLKKAGKIAEDISIQWELYLVNTYSLDNLQKLDLSEIKLPREWFEDWLERINEKI